MGLEAQRTELEQLGYDVVSETDDELIGVRSKWHGDCLATKLTSVALVRRVGVLTTDEIEADRERMRREARSIDPSRLPRGFQKGIAVLPIYLADRVLEDAKQWLTRKPRIRFAFFHVPSAWDGATGESHFVRRTPIWGALYYGKFRFLQRRLLEPGRPPAKEPKSRMGIALGAWILSMPLIQWALFYWFVYR